MYMISIVNRCPSQDQFPPWEKCAISRKKISGPQHFANLISKEAFARGMGRLENDFHKGPIPWVSRYLLWGALA